MTVARGGTTIVAVNGAAVAAGGLVVAITDVAVSVATGGIVGRGTVSLGAAVVMLVGVIVFAGSALSVAVAVLTRAGTAVGTAVGRGVIVGVFVGTDTATVTMPPATEADCVLAIVSVTTTFWRFKALVPDPTAVNVTAANKPVPSGPALLPKLNAPKVTKPATLSISGPTGWAVRPVLPKKDPSSTSATVTTVES